MKSEAEEEKHRIANAAALVYCSLRILSADWKSSRLERDVGIRFVWSLARWLKMD
jgi:hypothetical protein